MRHFIPNDGLFEITFPVSWTYKLKEGHIHEFRLEEGVGEFHLSVQPEDARKSYVSIKANQQSASKRFGSVTVYELALAHETGLSTINWFFEIAHVLFFATYTYSSSDRDSVPYKNDLRSIGDIISKIEVIPQNEREARVSWHLLGDFLYGIAAAGELLTRASMNGCFIECVSLLANQIDALLRISILLHDQLASDDQHIDSKWIHQGEGDKPIIEKEIYIEAKNRAIIDKSLFEELNSVYGKRNKVIHRYIISDLTTRDVLEVSIRYLKLKDTLSDIVERLEQQQMESGTGMTVSSSVLGNRDVSHVGEILEAALREKHGGIDFDNPPGSQSSDHS